MNLHGKVALITGGSAGIGLAIARQMVAAGAHVALVARTPEKLDEVVKELGSERAAGFALSVNDRAAVTRLPQDVISRFGSLDILVNNAGLHHRGAVQLRTAIELADVIETNLTSVVFLTRVALDYIPSGGAILNVSSLAGKLPAAFQTTYAASKAGLRAFSVGLREELAERNIRVCCLNPGPVDTGFIEDFRQVTDLTFSQPMSTPEEVATAALRTLNENLAELDVPMLSGKLATVGYLFPAFKKALRPLLERRGAANKQRYMQRKGIAPSD